MWQFTFSALTWGFLLTLLPLLIHLINLLRHRRVKWAAMDFLLQSYKKHRRWVWLKQLLLLLLRMLIVALIVAMLAQWTPQNRILEALGGATTHHYVLVDDSLSMSELTGDATCFDIALAEVRRIVRQAQADGSPHRLTLIRFSAAAGAARTEEQAPSSTVADVLAEPIHAQFDEYLEKKMQAVAVSELACGPLEALELSQQLIADDDAETKRLYIISDFRQVSWGSPTVVRDTLHEIQSSQVPTEFVSCVRQGQPNLAITSLEPEPGPQAAGVPLFVRVAVTNYGNVPATNVQLKLTAQTVDDEQVNKDPTVWMPKIEELPVEFIDEIAEGETITRRVQVYFPTTGRHVVRALLPDDPLRLDNSRWEVIDFRSSETCLVIDGDPEQRNAFFLQTIFQPGGRANTGVAPELQPVSFFRNLSLEKLAAYDAVYLMDVRELDESAVKQLIVYCDNGGGLAIFAGPQIDMERYNERLYLDGKGILPMPLRRQELLPPRINDTPDINIEGSEHPVFRNLLRGRNPIIRMAHVDRYLQPRQGWSADEVDGVEVIAFYRNGDPFAVEKTLGNGRILFFTTTFSPLWNDLARSPNILYALNLHAHISTGRRKKSDRYVGEAIEVQLDSEKYQAGITFITPGEDDKRFQLDREARNPDQEDRIIAVLGGNNGQNETGTSGVYDAIVKPIDGPLETRRYAVNIDPIESDLTTVNSRELISALAPVQVQWRYADESGGEWLRGDLPPNLALMALLILLLIAEQALAYSASYHPLRGGGRTV
jgi:hypothetical protein